MCKDDILSKITKLLNMTQENGASEAEALTAIQVAQRLALENNLDLSGLEVAEQVREVVEVETETKSSRPNPLIKRLANVIAKNFRCVSVIRHYCGKQYILFIGLAKDAEAGKQVFNFTVGQIKRLSEAYLKTRRKSDNFWGSQKGKLVKADYVLGFIDGVKSGLEHNAVQYGLVTTRPQEVKDHLNKMRLRFTGNAVINTYGSTDARQCGFRDGHDSIRQRNQSKVLSCA